MPSKSSGTKTGLVVDDPIRSRMFIRKVLENVVDEVRWRATDNVHDAIAIALRELPDIVVAEVNLQGKPGGIAICSRLRAEVGLLNTRFVLVASSGLDSIVRAAYEAGADVVLIGPVSPQRLASEVRRCLPLA